MLTVAQQYEASRGQRQAGLTWQSSLVCGQTPARSCGWKNRYIGYSPKHPTQSHSNAVTRSFSTTATLAAKSRVCEFSRRCTVMLVCATGSSFLPSKQSTETDAWCCCACSFFSCSHTTQQGCNRSATPPLSMHGRTIRPNLFLILPVLWLERPLSPQWPILHLGRDCGQQLRSL